MVSNGGPVCQSAASRLAGDLAHRCVICLAASITGSTPIAPLAGGAGGTKSWRVFADDGPAGM
jgi:hypothetical protein